MLLNEVVDALIILNPENNIPGLIIGPTVISAVGDVGLVGRRHRSNSFDSYSIAPQRVLWGEWWTVNQAAH